MDTTSILVNLVVLVISVGVLITAYLIFKGMRDARRVGDA